MILKIVSYGHPTLRVKGKNVAQINKRILRLVADMTETVINANGIGLAAQQVGSPLQLFVLNLPQDTCLNAMFPAVGSAPSQLSMPAVVVNPKIETYGGIVYALEGCLSFPIAEGSYPIQGLVPRPSRVFLHAQNLEGKKMEFHAAGLLARAIQHEFDHLQGVLFIDRMDPGTLEELRPAVERLLKLKTEN
ncbi:Peptide deformylase [Candidatus Xiphinematobacter sp. Idaho Grape]|uniref:peptide deformylase n=1 Tax=Candidatus Xiphinematobacter sp. Idaho Grape TaxID=1704307 RepID=UPI00070690CA|nr:peptide deformylase [Candidatus Xiphinematobacter sp. Idaho Grape]ALJ56256.1 Peptide deformylase [Candidatus Xiphinematobacter sp. Idaho Grape]